MHTGLFGTGPRVRRILVLNSPSPSPFTLGLSSAVPRGLVRFLPRRPRVARSSQPGVG